MRKTLIIPVTIVVIAIALVSGLYVQQNSTANSAKHEQKALQKQVADLQAQYAVAQAAGTIKMDSWKQYCDPFIGFCFKYPGDWTLNEATSDFGGGDKRAGATLTNPGKTVWIMYDSPLNKDGGLGSAHIVEVSDKDVAGSKLKIIGLYPVSSGGYSPGYDILNSGQLTDGLVPGKIGFRVYNARFDVGKHDAIRLSGSYSGTPFATSGQAKAWFNSIEGKTVKAVLASFGAK